MCGIAGIFAYHYASNPAVKAELTAIRDHMQARGPDAAGEYFAANGHLALGHRRLSIIDPGLAANQPFVSACEQYAISFNGEIYNYKQLKQTLSGRGYEFRTNSDTEVLIALYQECGTNMFNMLQGMYAFAIWDNQCQQLLLARDPYGIKPLYMADDGWTVRFASQVKALRAGQQISDAIEPAGVIGFYLFGSVPEPFTTWQEIRPLPAGHYQWVSSTGPKPPIEFANVSSVLTSGTATTAESRPQEPVSEQQISTALVESIERHLVADVPVGIFLSSGIDSATLAALLAQHSNLTAQAITLGFEEFEGQAEDEIPLASEIAAQFGLDHCIHRISEAAFHDSLPDILAAMDQPTIDGINTWFVSQAAASNGLKVAISGLGGDELFCGYPSFKDVPSWHQTLKLAARLPGAAPLFALMLGKLRPFANPKLKHLLRYAKELPTTWFAKRALFLLEEFAREFGANSTEDALERLQLHTLLNNAAGNGSASTNSRIAAMESTLYMRNQLLRDTDWSSMAHSLEVRVPLVDWTLSQQLSGLLGSGNLNKTRLARVAQPSLPAKLVNRGKTGFVTPIDRWQQQLPSTANQSVFPDHWPWARQWSQHVADAFDLPLL